MIKIKPLVMMMACASGYVVTHADDQASQQSDSKNKPVTALETIRVVASADASATGLMEDYAGGQVATGGRVGIFGNQKNLNTPFNLTSYTNQYIQERQAKSVGDVLKADPSVRLTRGFGNFQESYFIRGLVLSSDDTAYNGLYSILPRQYIPTELFERVEVLKGASAFLNGAMPSGGGIGGAINLLPKRAGNDPLNRVTVGTDFNGGYVSSDISRRFGEDQQFGVRVNTAYHGGDTAVDDEEKSLGLMSIGLDYRGERLRLSGDMGYTNNRLTNTRPSIRFSETMNALPSPIDSDHNYAQKWTYSNEEDVFGSYRAEYDLNDMITAYAAYGFRHSNEQNSLANPILKDASNGNVSLTRFDNARVDMVNTGEVGLRTKFETGSIKHNLVFSGSAFQLNNRGAWGFISIPTLSNIYNSIQVEQPFLPEVGSGGDLSKPKLRQRTRLRSVALGDNISAFNDQLNIMLGARYQTLQQETYQYTSHTYANTPYDENKVTPMVGVSYQFLPNWSVYANYIEALVQGEQASATDTSLVNAGATLSPYVSKQKEVGIKFEDGKIGLTLDYFNIDRQRGVAKFVGDNWYEFVKDGKNIHQGVELSTYGQLSDSLRLLGGIVWMDAKQKDTDKGLYDNNRVVGVPKLQANLGADWKLPVAADISVNTNLIYTGSSYANKANTMKLDDWTRVDLGAIYKTDLAQYPTTFNFSIQNIFDKNYWTSVDGGAGNTAYLNASQPRTFLLSASFDF